MIDKIFKNKLLAQIFRFGIVGGLAFIVDFAVLTFCVEILNLSEALGTALGFTISVIFNYILSIFWVFDVNKEKSQKKNFVLFIVLSIIGLLITELIMWLGSTIMGIDYRIVKIIATAIVMVFNFITRKIFLE